MQELDQERLRSLCIVSKNLIQNRKVRPENILVLTFTKAAATEMEDRFYKLTGKKGVKFGTFHSVFLEILIEHTPYTYRSIVSYVTQRKMIESAAIQLNDHLGDDDKAIAESIQNILSGIQYLKSGGNDRLSIIKIFQWIC